VLQDNLKYSLKHFTSKVNYKATTGVKSLPYQRQPARKKERHIKISNGCTHPRRALKGNQVVAAADTTQLQLQAM